MYSEWTSLNLIVHQSGEENQSVLEKFGKATSKDVTLGLVRQLASNLGITHPPERSTLTTDKDVSSCPSFLHKICTIYYLFRFSGVWKCCALVCHYHFQNMRLSRIVSMFIVNGWQLCYPIQRFVFQNQ